MGVGVGVVVMVVARGKVCDGIGKKKVFGVWSKWRSEVKIWVCKEDSDSKIPVSFPDCARSGSFE